MRGRVNSLSDQINARPFNISFDKRQLEGQKRLLHLCLAAQAKKTSIHLSVLTSVFLLFVPPILISQSGGSAAERIQDTRVAEAGFSGSSRGESEVGGGWQENAVLSCHDTSLSLAARAARRTPVQVRARPACLLKAVLCDDNSA